MIRWLSYYNLFLYLAGLRYSQDYGASWTLSSGSSSKQWRSASCDDSGQNWVASVDDGIYRSTDYGATWTRKYSGGGAHSCTSDKTGQYLAAIDRTSGNMYSSSDYGSSWITCYQLNNAYHLTSDSTGRILSIGCSDGRIHQSVNYGQSFREVSGSSSRSWRAICMPRSGK